MPKFLALNISVSQDGFMAGPNQSEKDPLGEKAQPLHAWAFATDSFQKRFFDRQGTRGIDNDLIERGFTNIGATIMGRNMFGPVRGEWPNDDWKGWWGPDPVFKHPVFILTHHPRESMDMGNGTIFTFVTGGIEQACEMAITAAKEKDIRVGGGAQTIQQFMERGLIDEIHIARIPITLSAGEALFTNENLQPKHYQKGNSIISGSVVHERYVRV